MKSVRCILLLFFFPEAKRTTKVHEIEKQIRRP